MKKIIPLLSFVLLTIVINAQITFESTYELNYGIFSEIGHDVFQRDNGEYAVAVWCERNNNSNIEIMVVDSYGELIESKIKIFSPVSGAGYNLLKAVNDGYIIGSTHEDLTGGTDYRVYSFDDQLESNYSLYIQGGYYSDGTDLIINSLNNFLMLGYSTNQGGGDSKIKVLEHSQEPSFVNNNEFSNAMGAKPLNIRELNYGGYIVSGIIGDNPLNRKLYVAKISSNLGLVWEKSFEYYSMEETNDIPICINGEDIAILPTATVDTNDQSSIQILRINRYGDSLGNYGIPVNDKLYCTDAITEENGDIVLTGYGPAGSTSTKTSMIRTDMDGNLVWKQDYNLNIHTIGTALSKTMDNGYIITGYQDSLSPRLEKSFLIKTDDIGNTTWIRDIEPKANVQLYPNPATDVVKIMIDGTESQIKNVTIYNIEGRLIKTSVPTNNSIDVSFLPAGKYIIKAELENTTLRSPLLISR